MRDVLIVSPTSEGLGGVASHVGALASRLSEAGFMVDVISSSNTPIIGLKVLKNPSFALTSPLKALRGRWRVVHAHNIPSATAMRTARADLKVLTIHGFYSEQVKLLHGKILGGIGSWFERKALSWADLITAVSKNAVEAYRSMGFEVKHIPNAIDLDSLKYIPKRVKTPQVVYVGRFSREKGVDMLLDASERARELNFVLVGSGPLKPLLSRRAAELPNVTVVGPVPHPEALGYIAGSDVLVLPSRLEGLSTVILEAMALKTPVVASDVGGNRELVEDGVTGLLVKVGDIEGLVEKIERLCNDPKLSARLVEEAYKRVKTEYSWSRVFQEYLKVYGLEGDMRS